MPINLFSLPRELRQEIFHVAIKQELYELRSPALLFDLKMCQCRGSDLVDAACCVTLFFERWHESMCPAFKRLRAAAFHDWLSELVKVDARIEGDLVGAISTWVCKPRVNEEGETEERTGAALAEMGLEGLVLAVREYRI